VSYCLNSVAATVALGVSQASGCGGTLIGARPPAASGHGRSPVGVQKREGSAGNPSWASLELERWCGGQVMVMKWWSQWSAVAAVLELRGRGEMGGEGAVSGSGGRLLL
jgi:hypothetical protein